MSLFCSRAIVANPKILILDEATAALDAFSEDAVQTALENATMNRTTLHITHKASSALKSDNILVFTPNGIMEQGPPSALLEAGGLFASFISSQTPTATSEVEQPAIFSKLEGPTSISPASEIQLELPGEVQSGKNEGSDLSLFSCLFIIVKAQRQHWLLMTAVFIPCFVGGKPPVFDTSGDLS
jgi:ABC-type multidrug transport system ATPase subunit